MELDAHEVLLGSKKLLYIQLEIVAKRLKARDMAQLSSIGTICDFCKQAHESGACLRTSLGLSKEQVKYTRSFTIIQ